MMETQANKSKGMRTGLLRLAAPLAGLSLVALIAMATGGWAADRGVRMEEVKFEFDSHGRRDPFIPLFIPTPTPRPTMTPTPFGAEQTELVRRLDQDDLVGIERIPPPNLPVSAIIYGGQQSLLVMENRVFTEGDHIPLDDGTVVEIVSIEPQQVRCLYFDEMFIVELPRAHR